MKHQTPNTKHQTPNTKHQTPNTKYIYQDNQGLSEARN
ncbi:TPA: sugar transferase, partial [Neisseria gonorrhoeae]